MNKQRFSLGLQNLLMQSARSHNEIPLLLIVALLWKISNSSLRHLHSIVVVQLVDVFVHLLVHLHVFFVHCSLLCDLYLFQIVLYLRNALLHILLSSLLMCGQVHIQLSSQFVLLHFVECFLLKHVFIDLLVSHLQVLFLLLEGLLLLFIGLLKLLNQ